MQCSNNLKQIGLALHGFESQNKTFPPGVKARYRFSWNYPIDNGVQTGGYEWTYFLHMIMCYMEQQGFYDAMKGPTFDVANPWADATIWENLPCTKSGISSLLCPSDGLGGNKVESNWIGSGMKSNYLGIFSGVRDGDNYSGRMYTNPVVTLRAVFRPSEGTPIADITDGTSNTMAVAEYLKGVNETDVRGAFTSNRAGLQFLYIALGPNSTADDNISHYFCPNDCSPDDLSNNLPCTGGDDAANSASPRSRHPGGVNAVFCDGSVHFIQDNITLDAWQCLGRIADGKTKAIDF